uniref:DCD domain-containing protein n=1 Tax=Triticum urartu TaxID=4572 RepID=A0A8R7QXK7_TRIUA
MNIIPGAYASSGFQYPCQIRFKRIWFCKPLMESEFEDAVQDNYYFARNKFNYGLTHQQVVKLLHLFSSRNRLQPRQNPRLQYEPPRESDISSVVNQTDNQSGSNSTSHGSLKSPCQTCTSSNVGEHAASPSHKLSEPMSLKHRELQLDISDVAKSNSSRSSLHTAANTDVVTEPGTQEAVDDKFTDDYIPLQLEDDTSDGVDTLFDLLGDESHSSESKGSSDSEENTAFHQPCVRKKDDCHQPPADSKLRADIEGRKSVFARLMGRPESFVQRQKFKTKPFPSKNAKSFSSPNQRRKRRRAQQSKSFPCDNRATLGMPSAHKMIKGPALDYSFVWDDDRRSNKFSGGKPSNIQRVLWDVSTKEPDRYGACKRLFVPEGSKNLIGSSNRVSNKPPMFAEVHESRKVTVEEKTRTPVLDFKRHAKDPNIEGGDPDYLADVEEAATKKTRLASASYHGEEDESETALVSKDTRPMDMLTVSDENCKLNSISLLSNDTCTQMAGAYLETEVQLKDEQQRIQGCREDVTGDKSSILGDSGNANLFRRLSFSGMQTIVETGREVGIGHVDTETTVQEKQNQSARSCPGGVNADKMLIVENPDTMESSPNHDEDGTLEMVATDHQDTSSLMILGIRQGKDGEAANPLTGSEDDDEGATSNTTSPDRRRSSSPAHDVELSKAEETRCQSHQTKNVAAAHEMSDSTDSFAVRADGNDGSKIAASTDSTSVHVVVNDLLGTNSESRTGFFDGSSSEPAEMIILSHDPGVDMEPH